LADSTGRPASTGPNGAQVSKIKGSLLTSTA
jgi:hypothetical protein